MLVFANGFATGAALNYTLVHLLHCTQGRGSQYVATSLLATFRSFAGSFGTTIGGGVFYRILRESLFTGFLELDGGDKLSPSHQSILKRLLTDPSVAQHGGLTPVDADIARQGYAAATRGLWLAAAFLSVFVIVLQALTGWEALFKTKDKGDADEVSGTADQPADNHVARA
jgi:hypothetical protein